MDLDSEELDMEMGLEVLDMELDLEELDLELDLEELDMELDLEELDMELDLEELDMELDLEELDMDMGFQLSTTPTVVVIADQHTPSITQIILMIQLPMFITPTKFQFTTMLTIQPTTLCTRLYQSTLMRMYIMLHTTSNILTITTWINITHVIVMTHMIARAKLIMERDIPFSNTHVVVMDVEMEMEPLQEDTEELEE